MLLNGEWSEAEAAYAVGLMEAWPAPTGVQRAFVSLARRRLGVLPATVGLERLGPARRTETLELLLVLTCLGTEVSDQQLAMLEVLNRQLERPTPWVDLVRVARAGGRTRATMTLAKHSPDSRVLFRTAWKQGGVFGVLPVVLSLLGRGPKNAAVAERYARLGALPTDTLGFAFFTHMRSRKLPMPGERGSLPEPIAHHDLMHVITGFDTDARGEGRLAGFYAGATARHPVEGADPFTFIMVGLLTFHLGYSVGPTFVGAERGVIDPAELLAFIELGSRVPFDVIQAWRFEEDLDKPLAEVRARFGLSPAGAR